MFCTALGLDLWLVRCSTVIVLGALFCIEFQLLAKAERPRGFFVGQVVGSSTFRVSRFRDDWCDNWV